MSHHGIAEILESRQFPGIAVRTPVRSAAIRDAAGRSTRVIYGGSEDTGSVERDLMRLAEQDGIDPSTTTLEITPELGQGVGKKGHGRHDRPPPPRYPKALPASPDDA